MSATTLSSGDQALLSRFVREGCQGSFAKLVAMHQSMVLGTALRRAADLEMARDVTQQVFTLLAQKAAWLSGRESIVGWLHHAATFLAMRAVRGEARLRSRHTEFAREPAARSPDTERWVALEDSLSALPAREREALLLHYFEDRSYGEMAMQLGISEAAVRKRVSRALHTLGHGLRKRGIATPATTVLAGGAALVHALPAQAGLATAALAASPASTPAFLLFSTIMSHTTAKIAATVLLLSSLPVAYQLETNGRLRNDLARAGTVPKSNSSETFRSSADASAKQNLDGLHTEMARLLADLRSEQERKMAADDQIAALTKKVQQVQNEVVVSYGQVEDLARRVAGFYRQMQDFEKRRAAADANERAALAQDVAVSMSDFGDIIALAGELKRLESEPEKAARFYATLLGEMAGLDGAHIEKLEAVSKDHFGKMRSKGLTSPQRPSGESEEWKSSRRRAFMSMEDALLAAMPPEATKPDRILGDYLDMISMEWAPTTSGKAPVK